MEQRALAKQHLYGIPHPTHAFARQELYIALTVIPVFHLQLHAPIQTGLRLELNLARTVQLGTHMQPVLARQTEKHVFATQDLHGTLVRICASKFIFAFSKLII